jgi:hypothetical protein
MRRWSLYYIIPLADNTFNLDYDVILIVLVCFVLLRVAIHRIMKPRVEEMYQIRGDVVMVPSAA